MRFIFHNPHDLIWYKSPFSFDLKRKGVQKYVHLLDYFLNNHEKIYVFVDRYTSRNGIRRILPRLGSFYIWAIFNRINPLRFKVITDISKINKEDIIFMFLYGNFTSQTGKLTASREESNNNISKTEAFKIVHLTHYIYYANIGSVNSKNANIDLFVAENNLFRNSVFFQNTFAWYNKDVYVLPFVPKDKFIRLKAFNERKNKAFATGTITFPMDDKVFLSHFNHSMVHPMRTEIYENRENLQIYLDSIITPITENKVSDGGVSNTKQEKYFSYDIVELFNEYKMFIVPEEVSSLPGMGFVEGMSCGSAFIGLNNPMYTDIGLKNKVNFIGYDGTLNDLKCKIDYYQKHQNELEEIANNGYNFVIKHFNKNKIVEIFLKDVTTLSLNRNLKN